MKKFEALSDERLQDLGEQDLDQEFPSRVMEEYKKLREHHVKETEELYEHIKDLAMTVRDLRYVVSWEGQILINKGIDYDARGVARYQMHAGQALERLKSIGLGLDGREIHDDASELSEALVEGPEALLPE